MSDPALTDNRKDAGVPQSPPPPRRRTSMFDDPLVRLMTGIAFGLVILYLAGIVGALFMGVLGTTAPRTAVERQIDFTQSAVDSGDHSAKAYADYVDALIDAGQYGQAQNIIDSAPKSAKGTMYADLEVAQARLYLAQKRYADAAKQSDAAAKIIDIQYKADLKKAGTNYAKSYGLNTNYYDAFLIKGLALQRAGDNKGAIAAFTVYLEKNPMESNVFVDRAEAKLKLNDKAGAKADYQSALRFVPDLPAALDGMKKIGAQQ